MMSLNTEMSFEKWNEDVAKKSPTFLYWDLVLEFEVCKSKIFHYQKDLVGRALRDLGSLFGPFYLKWIKQAGS